jgi:hypothetical protein
MRGVPAALAPASRRPDVADRRTRPGGAALQTHADDGGPGVPPPPAQLHRQVPPHATPTPSAAAAVCPRHAGELRSVVRHAARPPCGPPHRDCARRRRRPADSDSRPGKRRAPLLAAAAPAAPTEAARMLVPAAGPARFVGRPGPIRVASYSTRGSGRSAGPGLTGRTHPARTLGPRSGGRKRGGWIAGVAGARAGGSLVGGAEGPGRRPWRAARLAVGAASRLIKMPAGPAPRPAAGSRPLIGERGAPRVPRDEPDIEPVAARFDL